MSRELHPFRKRIDVLNREILRLLNRRVREACRIGAVKKRMGLRISDPIREKAIMDALVSGNRGPLDKKAVVTVFREIIRQTKRLERELS